MADVPVVVLVISFLVSLIGSASALWLLPGYYYMYLAQFIIRNPIFLTGHLTPEDDNQPKTPKNNSKATPEIQKHPTQYAFLFIPRWLLGTFTPIFWLGTIFIMIKLVVKSYLVTIMGEPLMNWSWSWNPFSLDLFYDQPLMASVSTILALIILGYGWYYMQTSWMKLIPDIKVTGKSGYIASALDAQVDLIAFFTFSLSCCFLIRIPFHFSLFREILNLKPLSGGRKIREIFLFEIFWALLDFFVLLCGVYVSSFGFYRAKNLIDFWKRHTDDFTNSIELSKNWPSRQETMIYAFYVFVDYLHWALTLFLIFLPWHWKSFYVEFCDAREKILGEAIERRRKLCAAVPGLFFKEYLAICCALFAVASIYRAYPIFQIFKAVYSKY